MGCLSLDRRGRQAAEQGRFGDALATIATVPAAAAQKAGPLLDVVVARIAAAQGRFADAQAVLGRLEQAGAAEGVNEPGVDRAIVAAEISVWRGQPDSPRDRDGDNPSSRGR